MHYYRESWLQRAGWLALGAVVLLSGTSAFAQQLREQVRQAVEERISDARGENSLYWIGVACEPLPEALRTQLGLSEQQGVLIDDVVADSPAAQAGLKQFDVILSVDDQSITQPQELARAVSQAQDKEVSIRYLRAGKEATIAVKPAPRPRNPRGADAWSVPEQDQESLRSWLEHMRGPGMSSHPLAMRFFHPGMVLPPGASAEAALPDDMSVTISKQGKAPAKIHVEQADKSWDVTEDKLQELPDEVRPHVERMLGRATFAATIAAPDADALKQWAETAPRRAPLPRRPDFESQLDERLNRIDEQLRQLQQSIEKLHASDEGQE